MTMSAADFLDQWFETDVLKATMSASGIIGTFLGIRSPGTAYVLLHHYMGEIDGAFRSWGFSRGGTGAISNAIAAAARELGVEIRTQAPVDKILVKNGRTTGIALKSGEEISANVVSSSVDPHLTFEKFLEPSELPSDFLESVRRYKFRGSSGKVNLALDALPDFKSMPGHGAHLRGAISISPSIDYMERAYDDAKYGHYSRKPYIDLVIPSLTDHSVAPPGKHVMSCFVQYAPYKLAQGTWDDHKEAFGDTVINTIAEHAPNIRKIIVGRQILTPLDLEREFGLTQGNIFQGELSLEQLFFLRPVPGWAYYRTPVDNLYMCGSATHPGGAITEESYPGFRASPPAHPAGPLRADIAADMQLEKFQCHMVHPNPRLFAPTPDGKALLFYNDHAKTAGGIARFSAKDAAKYTEFAETLEHLLPVLNQLLSTTPPCIDSPSPEDLWNLLKTGRSVRALGKKGMFDLIRWGPMAAADFVAEFFDT